MTSRTKNIIVNQPYILFLLTAAVLLLVSFFARERTVDIHLHDTMYVISLAYIHWIVTIALFLVWAIYKLADQYLLSNSLTWAHSIITIGVVIFFVIITLLPDKPIIQENNLKEIIFGSILILFIVAQFCFLLNLIGGLLRGKRRGIRDETTR
jgi:hypothetical protein